MAKGFDTLHDVPIRDVLQGAAVKPFNREGKDFASYARLLLAAGLAVFVASSKAQTGPVTMPERLPDAPGLSNSASISGTIRDVQLGLISGAHIMLETAAGQSVSSTTSDQTGSFVFAGVAPGTYILKVTAVGFASWKVKDLIIVHQAETFVVPTIQLGVEEISTTVNAITLEDLAEQQITAEEHQRILGVLPNFFVSYVPNAAPLTRKQKFKLAFVVSTDPLTFLTTGVTAGIEQAQGDFSGYGPGFGGYAQRYAASYGDRVSATVLGAALLPSLLRQDPRYFYNGKGTLLHRALYAISTVVICKGDNGKWQPNYSNVFGNLGAAGISTLYYPRSDQHNVQVTVDNTLVGIATGSFGTLFQEFLLRRFTHGAPPQHP